MYKFGTFGGKLKFLFENGAKFKTILSQVSAATLESQFELEDILDYIKTGIASVIEDEVTQRFVAEELKVSNAARRVIENVGLSGVKDISLSCQ